MSDSRDPAELESLSGAYALDALSAEEEAAFERHLVDSEPARTEAVELRDTAVELGLAAGEATPPPALRASVLAAIESTPQLAPVTELRPRRRVAAIVSGVGAGLLAAAAVTAIVLGVTLGGPSPEDVALASDVQTGTARIADGGTLEAKWSKDLDASVVHLADADAAPASEDYQLWYVGADGARSAGLLRDLDDWVLLDGDYEAGDTIAVTIEPKGGSTQPTSDPIAAIATA